MQNRFLFSSIRMAHTADTFAPSVEPSPHILFHNGCKLHYWLSGPAAAPLIILTHGEGTDHHAYDEQVKVLARSFRVLTWDIRGHGQSKSGQLFRAEAATDDLRAILLHEGLTSGVLVGMSVGGLIAQLFAYRFPEFARGLALFSCAPLNAETTPLQRFYDRCATGLQAALPYWLIMTHLPARFSLRAEVQKYTRETMGASGREHFLAAAQASSPIPAIEPDYRLPYPLLIAYGAYDQPGWISRTVAQWTAHYPAATIVSIPGAARSVTQDNPSYTTALLEELLRQSFREKRY